MIPRGLRSFADLKRGRQIIQVLTRFGFEDVTLRLRLQDRPLLRRLVSPEATNKPLGIRVRLVLEELGTTFVKLGQFFSMRPDLIPEEICCQLQALQDEVPPLPFEKVEPEITASLGCAIEEVFASFDPTPVASGSIAQVYYAVLKKDNIPVACKVRRPGAVRQVAADFDLISLAARLAHDNIPEIRYLDLPSLVDECRSWLLEELDFENEKTSLELFARNNKVEGVQAPRVFPKHSSSSFLVLQRLSGCRGAELKGKVPRARAAKLLASSFFSQVMVDGFFHGDPHGGNVFLKPDGGVIFLDWGLVGRFSWKMRLRLVALLEAILERDPGWVLDCGLELSGGSEITDRDRLEGDILRILDQIQSKPLAQINVGYLLVAIFQILGRSRIRVKSCYMLVARAIMLLEGQVRELDGEFDVLGQIQGYLPRVMREALQPARIRGWTRRHVFQLAGFLDLLPRRLDGILGKLDEGKLTMIYRHKGLEDLMTGVSRAVDRLVMGLILSSLILGGAIVIHAGVPPHIFDIPLLGHLAFILAALIGLWLLLGRKRGSKRQDD